MWYLDLLILKYLETLIRNHKIDIGNQNYFLEVLAKIFLLTFLSILKAKGQIVTRQVIWYVMINLFAKILFIFALGCNRNSFWWVCISKKVLVIFWVFWEIDQACLWLIWNEFSGSHSTYFNCFQFQRNTRSIRFEMRWSEIFNFSIRYIYFSSYQFNMYIWNLKK